MKTKRSSVFLGLALIIIGVLAFVNDLSFLAGVSTTIWMLVFTGSSILFFVAYFIRGIRSWGLLFPATIFAALSGTMLISNSPAASQWIPTLIIGSIAIPFIAAFFLDRSRTWALIPVFILGFVALIPPMANTLGGDVMAAFIVVMIGLPFIVVTIISPKAWWGIIPGGVFLSIGLMIGLTHLIKSDISVGIMFAGWMLTFGYLWLRQARIWAKYPAVAMGILACLMLLISMSLETYWSIGLIVAGLVMVMLELRPRHSSLTK